MSNDEIERLEQAARERWGEKWTIQTYRYADGTSRSHVWHFVPTEGDDAVKDRLVIGADGEIYHDRIRVKREVETLERDDIPEGISGEIVHVGENDE